MAGRPFLGGPTQLSARTINDLHPRWDDLTQTVCHSFPACGYIIGVLRVVASYPLPLVETCAEPR